MSQDSTRPVEHPLAAGVRVVRAQLAALRDASVWSLSDGDLLEALDEVAAAEAELAAVKLALIADVDGRNLGAAEATTTAGFLRSRLLLGPGEAKCTVKLALAVRAECTATRAAMSRGVCSEEHARVIVHAVTHLPPVGAEIKVQAEQFLIG